ncbi:MAG: ribonuclease III [Myxococcota bacterium]
MSDAGGEDIRELLADVFVHRFEDASLAELALSHPSHSHEVDGTRGNERLEFLGDAVLDLAVADLLYRAHPDWSEGDLTRARAGLVNQRALAESARALKLDRLVRLGRTERRTGGHRKDSVLANCLEAVLGAIYLDGGLAPVVAWAERTFGDVISRAAVPERRDAKTQFQEWAHAQFQTTPQYRTVRDSGTDNDERRFTVEVLIGSEVWGEGVGRSKRTAERAAAAQAVKRGIPPDG